MPPNRKKTAAPRAPLSRKRVLEAAIALADEDGIDALSMRKLARKLGVEAMSLYNHVASKDDILGGIIDLVAAEIDLAPDEPDWKAALRRRALSAHEALLRHSWASKLWMSTQSLESERLAFGDAILRGLREGGFPEDLTYHGFHVIQSHIIGYTLYVSSFDFDAAELKDLAASFLERFPTDEYPDLAEHIRQHMDPRHDDVRAFEFGLDLILDSLERLRDAG